MKSQQEKSNKKDKDQQKKSIQNLEKFIKRKEQENNVLNKILETYKSTEENNSK